MPRTRNQTQEKLEVSLGICMVELLLSSGLGGLLLTSHRSVLGGTNRSPRLTSALLVLGARKITFTS